MGPQFTSEELIVTFADLDKDGMDEIIVSCENDPSVRAVVKLLVKDGVATGFHIVESNRMCISFADEGYTCP